jgi:TolB protein
VTKTLLLVALGALAALLAYGVTLVGVEKPASATFPGENGKIAYRSYHRDDDGGGGIYIMNSDGSDQAHVANTGDGAEVQPPGSADVTPAWSPDGTKIASSRVTAAYDIYVTDLDGSDQSNITNTPNVQETWPKLVTERLPDSVFEI